MKIASVLVAWLAAQAAVAPVAIEKEHFHHLLFENSTVKVLDVQVPPAGEMQLHAHPSDHLAVVISGGQLRNEILEKPPIEHYTGDAGTVVFLPAGPPHRQINIDDHAVR